MQNWNSDEVKVSIVKEVICKKYSSWSYVRILICNHYDNYCSQLSCIFNFIIDFYGPGSVVGIATADGLDGPGFESRWGEIFRTCPDLPW